MTTEEQAALLCANLERLQTERAAIYRAQRALQEAEDAIEREQREKEKTLMALLNDGEFGVHEIGNLRIVFDPIDKYNSKPKFWVQYPHAEGMVQTHEHYLRKPNKEKSK